MPDANLRVWVEANFPGAITGNFIDQDHPGVMAATEVYLGNQGIVSLMGMSAFSNLQFLNAEGNPINPNTLDLPPGLMSLGLNNCGLTGTLNLCFASNTQLQTLSISNNQLTSISWCDDKPSAGLNASHNLLTGWVGTPPGNMSYLNLSHNLFVTPPAGLFANYVDISHNFLNVPPEAAWGVSQTIIASHNQITSITGLPCVSGILDLSNNLITYVQLGPQECSSMQSLNLSHNPLTNGVTNLPVGLTTLTITDTELDCLTMLPLTLQTLYCTNNTFTCIPNRPVNLNLNPANFGFNPVVCQYPVSCTQQPASLRLRACLGGPWVQQDGLMHDALRQQGLIPLTEPYSAAGYTYVNNIAPLTMNPALLIATGPHAIVDWVIVELRIGPNMPGPLHQSVPALLRRDGWVIAANGDSLIHFQIPQGNYRVAVKHRNHLGGITFAAQQFGQGTKVVDIMSFNGVQVNPYAFSFGSNGTRLLTPGDVTADKLVKYMGNGNDRDPILTAIGGSTPTQVLAGVYHPADVNMDGHVKYIGANNDRDPILQVVGGSTPTSTRSQLPVY